jgi:hypothetical protein
MLYILYIVLYNLHMYDFLIDIPFKENSSL